LSVHGIDINGRNDIEARLLKPERHATNSAENVDTDWAFFLLHWDFSVYEQWRWMQHCLHVGSSARHVVRP